MLVSIYPPPPISYSATAVQSLSRPERRRRERGRASAALVELKLKRSWTTTVAEQCLSAQEPWKLCRRCQRTIPSPIVPTTSKRTRRPPPRVSKGVCVCVYVCARVCVREQLGRSVGLDECSRPAHRRWKWPVRGETRTRAACVRHTRRRSCHQPAQGGKWCAPAPACSCVRRAGRTWCTSRAHGLVSDAAVDPSRRAPRRGELERRRPDGLRPASRRARAIATPRGGHPARKSCAERLRRFFRDCVRLSRVFLLFWYPTVTSPPPFLLRFPRSVFLGDVSMATATTNPAPSSFQGVDRAQPHPPPPLPPALSTSDPNNDK